LLLNPSLYTAPRFAAVILSAPTLALLAQSPTGEARTLLNRLLLQDAYPLDLAKTIAGDTEGANARFIVTLSNPSQYPISVDWRTDAALTPQALPADGAATPSPLSGADFVSDHQTLTFSPGVLNQVIAITTLDDSL